MNVRRKVPTKTGLPAALQAVSQKVGLALEATHDRLKDLRIPHVLIGGLAVGTYGYQYATKDVDWLVAQGDAFDGDLVMTFKPGVPVSVGDVAVDYLTPDGPDVVVDAMWDALFASRNDLGAIVVSSPELLVWMKLKAGRSKDVTAVVELLRAGHISEVDVRSFLLEAGDSVVLSKFEAAAKQAKDEDEAE